MHGVCVTGTTGLLGRYLLRDLLLAGIRVVALVRPSHGGESGRNRVDQVLQEFETQLHRSLPRPVVIEGQLHESGLGLSSIDRQWLHDHCSSLLHCAASIKFQRDARDDEPYRSNVGGTRQLLELCQRTGIREFHHVSTAYVCGDRGGRILESELEAGQQFRNDYERSKFSAERMLRECGNFASLTVYRPSIIVGDSTTGFTSTFHGFYLPLQLAHTATIAGLFQDRQFYMNSLGLSGTERKNLVPVDWVSQVIVRIFGQPNAHGQTYHLTNPRPKTTAELDRAIAEAIRLTVPADTWRGGNSSPPQQGENLAGFREQMVTYQDYLSDDPEFDVTQTLTAAPDLPCPELDHATLVKLGKYAIDRRFGWRRQPVARREFDVPSRLAMIQGSLDSGAWADRWQPLRLEVSGAGGGTWRIARRDGKFSVLEDDWLKDDPVIYLNCRVLYDILRGHMTVFGALQAGRIVLTGNGEQISLLRRQLDTLCSLLSQSQYSNTDHAKQLGNVLERDSTCSSLR